MAIEPRLMTADELLSLPRGRQRHELVRGELRTMPPTNWEHSGIEGRIFVPLERYTRSRQLGEVRGGNPGFRLTVNPDTVLAPDVAFVARARVEAAGRVRAYWPGAPDLVVEIISPNDRYTEVDEKVADWLAYGARLVFVVNPRRRTVAVHRPGQPIRVLTEADVIDGEDVVPGWTLPVRELFA